MSQSRNEPIPGLVYEADAPESRPAAASQQLQSRLSHRDEQGARGGDVQPGRVDEENLIGIRGSDSRLRGRGGDEGSVVEMQDVAGAEADAPLGGENAATLRSHEADAAEQPGEAGEEEEGDAGVKLGLGDFVFYSVLVARRATDLCGVSHFPFSCLMQGCVY
jgi:presenilin 1